MSRRSRAARNKEQMRKREPGPYIAMPFEVGRSIEYWGLSAQAMRVLNYLWFAQYNGQNNGDLSAAYSQMRERGFKSRDTVWRALRELEEKGWIVRTRQGGRHRCTLWALTMCALDYDPKKMEISARSFPRGKWRDREKDGVSSVPTGVSITVPSGPTGVSIPTSDSATGPTAVSVSPPNENELTRRPGTLLGFATPPAERAGSAAEERFQ